MQIVIIGSGNVATVLGKLAQTKKHDIIQVFSRNNEHARALANELGCSFTNDSTALDMHADIYLVAVSDSALYEFDKRFNLQRKLVLHTAGSVSKDVLTNISDNYGVLYPLQSLRKEVNLQQQIPFLIDGNTNDITTFIEDFAKSLSSNVFRATDEERLKLHVAAVVVSNFTNHLYALAESFCTDENVDFKLLLPLIQETATRITFISPSEAQTGPAIRNDVFTLDKHLRLLKDHPKLKTIYLKLTDSIIQR